jgi:hypothetical protein
MRPLRDSNSPRRECYRRVGLADRKHQHMLKEKQIGSQTSKLRAQFHTQRWLKLFY